MSVHDPTSREGENDVSTLMAESDGKPTPLPKQQIFILLLTLFSEPITGLVIYPFINQFVRKTGVTQGDEHKTGYYAGIVESAFFLAECSTVVPWGYLSDRIGRRPVLLIGPLGMTLSILFFGASARFSSLVVWRFFQGVFNGCIGVAQSMIAEMTDASNVGDAYALEPLMWSIGSTIAPLIGGVFSNPATGWPNTLGRLQFLQDHPYFLPCAVSGFIAFTSFTIAALALKETLPLLVAKRKMLSKRDAVDETPLINHGENCDYDIDSTTVQVQSSSSETTPRTPEAKLSLLNRGLFMIYLNYIFLAFLDMGHFTLLPLFYSTSIPSGGLGLDPSKIGIVMGCFGFVNAIVQARYLGPSIRKFGARKVYIICFPSLFGCFALYPIMKHLTQGFGGVNSLVIICMMIQLSLQMLVFSSSGSMQVVLAQHVSLSGGMGTAIGIAQMSKAAMGALAPALVSALYSISSQRQLAGGDLVFYILMGVNMVAIRLSYLLPPRVTPKSGLLSLTQQME